MTSLRMNWNEKSFALLCTQSPSRVHRTLLGLWTQSENENIVSQRIPLCHSLMGPLPYTYIRMPKKRKTTIWRPSATAKNTTKSPSLAPGEHGSPPKKQAIKDDRDERWTCLPSFDIATTAGSMHRPQLPQRNHLTLIFIRIALIFN